jgi:hypothetical protein
MNIRKGRLYQQLLEQPASIVPRHTLVEAKCWPCLEKLATLQFPPLWFGDANQYKVSSFYSIGLNYYTFFYCLMFSTNSNKPKVNPMF